MRKGLLALTLSLLLVSCGKLNEITAPSTDTGGPGGEPIDATATFTRVQSEIFGPTCAVLGCHDPIVRSEGLSLSAAQSYANTVNVNSTQMPQLVRVRPNDPSNSYLYRKLIGVGITGDRMPQSSPPLSDAQLKLVRDWIRRGAPND